MTVFDSFFLFMPRANHSHRSLLSRSIKKSDREQITPIALYKRAALSDLLLTLMTKE